MKRRKDNHKGLIKLINQIKVEGEREESGGYMSRPARGKPT